MNVVPRQSDSFMLALNSPVLGKINIVTLDMTDTIFGTQSPCHVIWTFEPLKLENSHSESTNCGIEKGNCSRSFIKFMRSAVLWATYDVMFDELESHVLKFWVGIRNFEFWERMKLERTSEVDANT